MFNRNIIESPYYHTLEQALLAARGLLASFIHDPDFSQKAALIFGTGVDVEALRGFVEELVKADFSASSIEGSASNNTSILPRIEIRSASEINHARGAFAGATNTIYLSEEFLEENNANIEAIAAVLIEEMGHAIDFQVNASDTQGDEGELFADLVRGVVVSEGELQRIKGEDDSAVITIDGQTLQIEQSTFNLGLIQGYKEFDDYVDFNDSGDIWIFSTASTGGQNDYVAIYSDFTNVDFVLEIRNSNNQFIRGSDDNDYRDNYEEVSLANLPQGTYRAVVYNKFGTNIPYPFGANYTLEIDAPQVLPDLTPYQASGWNDKLVISTQQGTKTDAIQITTNDTIYIDWSYINQGTGWLPNAIGIRLLLDGTAINTWTDNWSNTSPLNSNAFRLPIEDFQIAPLSAGNHTIRLEVDYLNQARESNENNNFFEKVFTVKSPAGVKISESNGGTSLSEDGLTDSYTVVLTGKPTSNVTLNIAPDNQSTTTPASLIFTPSNWDIPQTVTVSAINDSVVEGSHTTTITHTVVSTDSQYNGISAAKVVAAIADNDNKLILIQNAGNINVTEGGTSVSNAYFVQLTSAPTSNVTVTINTDGQSTVNSSTTTTLTFTPANWSITQGVTVAAVDDAVVEGSHTSTISHQVSSADSRFNGIAIDKVMVNVIDNDQAGLKITETGGSTNITEGGATDTYQIQLSSQPTANVTVSIASDSQSTATPVSLNFTPSNWNTAQTITVTAIDDTAIEGSHTSKITHTLSSTDSRYNGITVPSVTAAIADNDRAGVTISQSNGNTSLTEGGAPDSYTVVLAGKPTADVTITVSPDSQSTITPSSLIFTVNNWNTPQTVSVSAVDDTDVEGNHSSTILHTVSSSDSNYNRIIVDSVTATITDNDGNASKAGLEIIESDGSTNLAEGGASDTYTIALKSKPTANVTITIAPDKQSTPTPTSLIFTPDNWNKVQTVTLQAFDDSGIEGTHTSIISHNISSTDPNYNGLVTDKVVAKVEDNDVTNINSVLNKSNPAFKLIGLDLVRQDSRFKGIDGSKIGVVVIDTGIDATHPLLKNNVKIIGDLVRQKNEAQFGKDENSHGTHVAGTIGSIDPNIGIANDVNLIGMKTGGLNGTDSLSPDAVKFALQWVLQNHQQHNIKVINMSLGGGFFNNPNDPRLKAHPYFNEVQALMKAGVTVVASAGNDYADYDPQQGSGAPGIFSTFNVGAVYDENEGSLGYRDQKTGQPVGDRTTAADRHTFFSERPSLYNNVIFAPGAMITSTVPSTASNKGIGDKPGTSMAAPHVAGVVALLQEAAFQFGGRYLSTTQVQEIIVTTADKIFDGNDEDTTVKVTNKEYPRINAYKALNKVYEMFAGGGGGGGNPTDPNGTLTNAFVISQPLDNAKNIFFSETIGADGSVNVGGKDVDIFKFELTIATKLKIETLAASSNQTQSLSLLDFFSENGESFLINSLEIDQQNTFQTVDVNNSITPTNTILRLFDSNGTQLAINDDKATNDVFSSITIDLKPGTYFTGVSGFDNSKYDPKVAGSGVAGFKGDYQLSFSLAGGDPNGLLSTATPLNILQDSSRSPIQRLHVIGSDNVSFNNKTGVFEKGISVGPSDVDLFVVDVPDNGKLFLDIDTPENVAQYFSNLSYVDSLIRIFDDKGNQIISNDNNLFKEPNEPFPKLKKEEKAIDTTKTIGLDGNEGHLFDSFIQLDVTRGQKLYIGISDKANLAYDPNVLTGRDSSGKGGYYQLFVDFINNDLNGAISQATDNWKIDVDRGVQYVAGKIGIDGRLGIDVGDRDVDFNRIRSTTGGWLEVEIE
jgi:subtilisin family serine protease